MFSTFYRIVVMLKTVVCPRFPAVFSAVFSVFSLPQVRLRPLDRCPSCGWSRNRHRTVILSSRVPAILPSSARPLRAWRSY